jgi:hypothetical protein
MEDGALPLPPDLLPRALRKGEAVSETNALEKPLLLPK